MDDIDRTLQAIGFCSSHAAKREVLIADRLAQRKRLVAELLEWGRTKAPYVPRTNFISSKPEHKDFARKEIVGTDFYDHLTALTSERVEQ